MALSMAASGDDGSARPNPPLPSPGSALDETEISKHLPSVSKYLMKILRRDEIEDGVQTVVQRVLENREKYRGESTIRVWILGIARNVGFEIARTRTKLPKLAEHPNEGSTTGDIVLDYQEPTQEELLGRKQQQALALAALDGLQLDDKLALLVTYVDGLPGPEAAELLGVSFAAFRQRLSRARQALSVSLRNLMESGAPGSPQVMAQWQALLNPETGDVEP